MDRYWMIGRLETVPLGSRVGIVTLVSGELG
jgi:hypothetical protein